MEYIFQLPARSISEYGIPMPRMTMGKKDKVYELFSMIFTW